MKTTAGSTPAYESAVETPRRLAPGGSLEARLLRRMLHAVGDPAIELLLWNGERVAAANAAPIATVRIADRATFFNILRDPHIGVGDAYSSGQLDIDGDMVQFITEVYQATARAKKSGSLLHRVFELLNRRNRNTLAGARDNIHRHYDLGNDFYALWLGETMAYTCAYYPAVDATLEQAQTAKMDHVCRKLRLQRGDTVVEAGCGWGSLALHMAGRYGARVRAFNISAEQIAFARERCKSLGLESQVEFVEDDYRNISGRYDVFASVGMLEHVGREHYPELGQVVQASLGENGRGLIHTIGRNRPQRTHPWIERHIFPGGYVPSLGEMMQIFEPRDLSVLDVENLRLHYALTLRHWLQRYEAVIGRVREMFDEQFVRMWRLYLNGSIAAFESGTMQLFQVLFTKARNNDLPLTREYLYSS
jgi:cyclopropane-fatty-acyl-phospholipid synthase